MLFGLGQSLQTLFQFVPVIIEHIGKLPSPVRPGRLTQDFELFLNLGSRPGAILTIEEGGPLIGISSFVLVVVFATVLILLINISVSETALKQID